MGRGEPTTEKGVYRRSDGRLVVRVTVTHPQTGERRDRQRTMPETATMADAVQARQTLRQETRRKMDAESRTSSDTIADYAEQWLERKARKVKASTIHKYRTALAKRVLPKIGEIPLGEYDREDTREWVRWAETATKDDGEVYSTASVRSWWGVMKTMLKDAYADGHFDRHPVDRIPSPTTGRRGVREHRTLTAEEVKRLLEAVDEHYPQRYAEVAVLARCGLRPGELYALKWEDVDFADQIIRIERSVWRGEVSSTKTDAPREVPVTQDVLDALQSHRQWLMRTQHPGLTTRLCFPSDDGELRYVQSLQHVFERVAPEAGIDHRVTPQVLRRTVDTLMVAAGNARETVRCVLGHSSQAETERYFEASTDEKHAAMQETWKGGGATG